MFPRSHKRFAKIRVEFRGCFLVGENISSNKRDKTFKSVSRSWHLNRQMSNFFQWNFHKMLPACQERKCIQIESFPFISMLDNTGEYHQHLSIVKQQDSHGFRHSDTYDSHYIATNFNTMINSTYKVFMCVWLILLESHIQN